MVNFFAPIWEFFTVTLPLLFNTVFDFFNNVIALISNIPFVGDLLNAIIGFFQDFVQFVISATGGCGL